MHANDNRPVAVASNAAGEPLTFVSMFSGIEAASVAFSPLGWKALAFAEIEKFPSAVLAHHYPDVLNVGDMTAHDWSQYRGKVDIVCGGPPCQAFSVAGLRNSMADARGNLSLSYMRALHAIKPRNAIVENVPGWLNTPDNAFGCFLAGLVGADAPLVSSLKRGRWPDAGMVDGPEGRAAWRILDAQYFGLAQRRRRVIVVADFGIGADPAAVLFEPESLPRHSPPSREAGQKPAPTISARTKDGGGLGTDFDLDGGLVESTVAYGQNRQSGPVDTSHALNAHSGPHGRLDFESETFLVQSVTGDQRHAGILGGADASEDGTGRGTPIVCFSAKDYGADAQYDLSPTLRAGGHSKSHANAGVMPAVALNTRQDPIHDNDCAQPLGAKDNGNGVLVTSAVRRLTPVECERLQGFPDGYTDIPWRGKPTSPDGPRYKALGNSWAVPKFAWLGRRIAALMPALQVGAANDNATSQAA
jgi:DNA (cytosine-5)-methyltransferase 1